MKVWSYILDRNTRTAKGYYFVNTFYDEWQNS